MKRRPATFYCFSPPVMIATFAFEIGLILFTWWRYKMSTLTRLSLLLFASLAIFQLAEFMVCEGPAASAMAWSRIGYAAITLLPPLGVHLAYTIGNAKQRRLLIPAYVAAAGFAAFFLFGSNGLTGHACLGNYVIFQVATGSGMVYALYYYGLLAAGILVSRRLYKKTNSPKIRRALAGLVIGYAAFIVPSATVNLLDPATIVAIPSIMCGFAVLLAGMVTFVVLPAVAKRG